MCGEQKFFLCKHCKNLVGMIEDAGVEIYCCGEPMEELVPNTTEAAVEKHVPVIETLGNQVTIRIGSMPHPMINEHHIVWVYLQTEQGGQRKCPAIEEQPAVSFALTDNDKPVTAYAYCNLHGLWKADA